LQTSPIGLQVHGALMKAVATAGSSQIARKALAHALMVAIKTATLDFMAVSARSPPTSGWSTTSPRATPR